ncbi:hypothetical protein QBC34DRAFT_118514 [Podospora aff. communis PSN243]|uniref:Uncharacterized protein n=1 Tax=Podospora aff. communis PSN243 TaxID=3040156 RepID=A0AAV9GK83_9PEZI|nr:hypothetical protein QBC34DRAFT_118514 [Podospora aff. communis PSN243]
MDEMDELMVDNPGTFTAESGGGLGGDKLTAGSMAPPPLPLDTALRGGGRTARYNTAADEIQRRLAYSFAHSLHGQSGLSRNYQQDSESHNFVGDDINNSDWSSYGEVPNLIDDWDREVTLIDGSDQWNARQMRVHQLIYMRGIHPMIPSTWKMSYKMWGLGQPQLEHVFAPSNSNRRVIISSLSPSGEVAAAKALESLFYVSQKIMDYENQLAFDKMELAVVKAIQGYIKWALKDAGINTKLFPPMFYVHGYPINSPDFRVPEGEDDESYRKDGGARSTEGRAGAVGDDTRMDLDQTDSDDENSDDEDTRRFTQWLDRSLHTKMRGLGERWREFIASNQRRTSRGEEIQIEPPTLFGFAVVQHAVIIVSHDASSSDNPVIALEKISLNDRGLWLWNALSLAIPINVGKMEAAEISSIFQEQFKFTNEDSADDPDL